MNDNDPLSADIAVARLKKYIANEEGRILLYDLLINEVENIRTKFNKISNIGLYPNRENLKPKLDYFLENLDILIPLVINGVYWCKQYHHQYFIDVMRRISQPQLSNGSRHDDTVNFEYLPSSLLFYAIGITAVIKQDFELLNLFFNIKIQRIDNNDSESIYLIETLQPNKIPRDIFNEIINQSYKTPVSTYLRLHLRPFFQKIMFNDKEYTNVFDIFEYLISLNYMHLVKSNYSTWAPWGEYKWRNDQYYKTDSFLSTFLNDKKEGIQLAINSGMFDGSTETYDLTNLKLKEFLNQIHI